MKWSMVCVGEWVCMHGHARVYHCREEAKESYFLLRGIHTVGSFLALLKKWVIWTLISLLKWEEGVLFFRALILQT